MINTLGRDDYVLGFGTHCAFIDFAGLISRFYLAVASPALHGAQTIFGRPSAAYTTGEPPKQAK
jgi:hypothetical protein